MIRAFVGSIVSLAITVSTALAQGDGLIGSDSCAASTCHGNQIGLGESWNHSLTQFLANDPHASAGLVLVNSASQSIVRAIDRNAEYPSPQYDAVLRNRCVSCHTTAAPSDCEGTEPLEPAFLAAGVSCESCHGPAADWMDHHTSKSFGDLRTETSIRDTKSIVGRTNTCVRCHVGSRTEDKLVRDMNHDLIAAGHPALRFDLLIYDEILPAHWDRQSVANQDFTQSHVRTRTISRWINLAAASELAAERADVHTTDSSVPNSILLSVPWPEFSDYDCFGCHQSLRTLSPRTSLLKISDGLPIWNSWHSVGQIELYGKPDRLKKLSPHRSSPETIADLGAKIAKIHRDKADGEFETAKPRDVFDSIVSRIKQRPPFDWHEAAVEYLNLDAAVSDIESAENLEGSNSLRIGIQYLGKLLRYGDTPSKERSYLSPAKFDPGEFQSAVVRQFLPTDSPQSH